MENSEIPYAETKTPKDNVTLEVHAPRVEKEDKKNTKEEPGKIVPLFTLFRYADHKDIILMIVGTLCAFASGIGQPIQIIFFGDVIAAFNPTDQVISEETRDAINDIAIKFIYLAIVILVAGFGQVACWSIAASRQAKVIRHRYVMAILRKEIGWFDVNEPSKLPTQIADSSLTIQDGIGRKIADGANFFAMGLGGVIIGFIKGWEMTLVLLAALPFIMLSAGIMAKALTDAVQSGSESYGKAGGVADETISNIRTVHAFNSLETVVKKYSSLLAYTEKAGIKKGLSIGWGTGFMFFTVFCAYAVGMFYGAVLVARDQLEDEKCTGGGCYDGGRVLIVFFSVIMGAMALGMAGPSIQAMFMARAAAYRVFEIIDQESKIDALTTEGKKLDKIDGDIEVSNIKFHYPSRPGVNIFNNYSLKIKSGEKVALVGGSGSGKSTIVSLLERFYDPIDGTITLDGHDLKTLNVGWLRSQIGYVGQEPVLFADTIGNNIGYGKPGASLSEIHDAAKKANAYNFIVEFPNGFDTQVGEKGIQLSGGQKQRIAIARAIIKDPSILLLDEATSALDSESERVVQKSLDAVVALKKRTTIVIAHRLSTIQNADRIAVHHEGEVVEIGSHDELLAIEHGHYRKLWETQGGSLGASKRVSADKEEKYIPGEGQLCSTLKETTKDEEIDEGIADVKVKAPIGRIWNLSKPESGYFFFASLGACVNGATYPVWGVLLTKITVLFFRYDYTPSEMKREARWWSLAFIIIGLVYMFSMALQSWGFAVVSERVTRRIREMAFKSIVKQEIGFFDRDENTAGALTTRLATDSCIIQSISSEFLNRTLVAIFSVVTAFVIAFYYSWEMTLIEISVFPILAFGNYIQAEMMGGGVRKSSNAGDIKAGALVSESISSIRTVVSFNMEKTLHEKYWGYVKESAVSDVRVGLLGGVAYGFSQGIMIAVLAFLFWYGGRLVANPDKDVSFEDMFMVLMAVFMCSFGIGMATQNMTDSTKAKKAAVSVFGIIDRTPEIDASSTEGDRPKHVNGLIEIKNVDFAYPSRPLAQVYKNYNLRIEVGQKVALVGASGSGKSTAVSLVERFYDPNNGVVLLDGKDIKSLNISWLREQISLVSQEPVLFSGTIAENIGYGKKGSTREEIIDAAQKANAHDFISTFPDGYDTEVGDRGVQVSGGQKQRLALARAIIRDPAVLLLDEATSALDNESERIVQESLDKLLQLKKRTTIIIAHRLSTIRDADLIAVTKNGLIVEMGNHDQLMSIENGEYRTLVTRKVGNE